MLNTISNDILFSVVIPLYNKEPHVLRAINSVLHQTISNFELIIVNDASTDKSLEKIMSVNDSRIRILHRSSPGSGGYAARNLGAESAESEWVAFLDADDEWHPEHLFNYTKLINNFNDASVLACGWATHESGNCKTKFNSNVDKYYANNAERGAHLISFYDYLNAEVLRSRPIWTSVACIKRKTLITAGGFPEDKASRGGDVDTWIRCIDVAGSMAWSPNIGAIYYRDAVNMVSRTTLTATDFHMDTTDTLLEKYSEKYSSLLKVRANNLVMFAWGQNLEISSGKNFNLIGNLYKDVQFGKVLLYSIFSTIPIWISSPLFIMAKKIRVGLFGK